MDWDGFKWLIADDTKNSVLAFERIAKNGSKILVVINFSLYDYHKYGFFMDPGSYQLILNSDDFKYSGRGVEVANEVTTTDDGYAEFTIPASSVQYYYMPAKK